MNPFAELDAIYNHLLSSVDNIQITLRVLGLCVVQPTLASGLRVSWLPPELFLSLEPGDIHLALMNLSSIVTYDETSGNVDILHASLVDFLSDRRRSTAFYIDTASTCTDFFRRILQCVQGPDGIQAGNITLFRQVIELFPCLINDQLQSDIVNLDLDALITASIRWLYYKDHPSPFLASILDAPDIWQSVLRHVGLEDGAKKEVLDRLHQSVESRIQIYQSDWRLHLLLTLTACEPVYFWDNEVLYCRRLDILLEMSDDHDLHIADKNALDLRHPYTFYRPSHTLGLSSYHVNGDTYASAALHCMRFLSNPPKYSHQNDCLEIGIIYVEWWAACAVALDMCCNLLPRANTSLELVQFISNHDIHPEVKKDFSVHRLWYIDMHILAFLSRANVCVGWRVVNWRIISAIQRYFDHRPPSQFAELYNAYERPNESMDLPIGRLIKQRLDQCCSKACHYIPSGIL